MEIPGLCLSDEVIEQWEVYLQMVEKGMLRLVVVGVAAMLIVIHVSHSEFRLRSLPFRLRLSPPPLLHLQSVQHLVVLTTPKPNTEHSTAQRTPEQGRSVEAGSPCSILNEYE
jgi:hypothetical protein